MAVRELLRIQEPYFRCVGILKLVPRCDKCINVPGECVEFSAVKWAVFSVVMTSLSVPYGTQPVDHPTFCTTHSPIVNNANTSERLTVSIFKVKIQAACSETSEADYKFS